MLKKTGSQNGRKRIGLALAALLGSAVLAAFPLKAAHADSITLYRIYTDSTHTVTQLDDEGIDVWQVQPNFAEAPLSADQINWLQANGWNYDMSRQTNGPSFGSSYHTDTAMAAKLQAYAKQYPNLATLQTIGTTLEGRSILALKISNNKNKTAKPKSLWIGGTHAREIGPPEVMLANIDYLLTGYGQDPDVTWMLDNREVYIVPILNQDGHAKAEQLLNWRKNTDTRWGGDGVDINRNYDEMPVGVWGNPIYGTSTNPFNETFCGGYAFSEPESTAVKNLVESVMGTNGTPATVPNGFNMVVDMHSFGSLIMWPWNWTADITQYGAAADVANMQKIGEKFATYNTYKAELGDTLYPTTGDTTDWAYGFHKIPSFTIEIGKTFWSNDSELPGLISENRGEFTYGVKIQDDPYGRVNGPDTNGLSATAAGGTITVTGQADDTHNGSDTNTAVEVFVDQLGARGTGQAGVLGKSTNSGASTSFTATLPTAGLSSGKHLLIVEAQDNTGAWGAPSAVWVTIP